MRGCPILPSPSDLSDFDAISILLFQYAVLHFEQSTIQHTRIRERDYCRATKKRPILNWRNPDRLYSSVRRRFEPSPKRSFCAAKAAVRFFFCTLRNSARFALRLASSAGSEMACTDADDDTQRQIPPSSEHTKRKARETYLLREDLLALLATRRGFLPDRVVHLRVRRRADPGLEEFLHFAMDLEFLARRKEKWRLALQKILFRDGDIVELAEEAEDAVEE